MTLLVIAVVLALVCIGAPLYVIVGVTTASCLAAFTDLSTISKLQVLVQHMENLATKQEFLAIPLFVASGAIMTAGGIARRLVELMQALLGALPGGLAIAAVAACMFFAAISGSSPVTLIAVGSMMFPALVQNRYPENFSLGLITTAGSLGCLVPPSLSMLIYAISVSGAVSVDASDLFLAGLIPACLVAGLLSVYCVWQGRKVPGERPRFSLAEVKDKAKAGAWSLLLPILVLGGIYGGWYTPSQAGAVAVAYSLIVTIWIHRELTLKRAFVALVDAAELMGALLPIIVLAFGLNEFLALVDVQERLLAAVRAMNLSAAGFLLLVNIALVVLGALMDSVSATLIFAPMLAPVAYQVYGIDPIHFGVIFVVNMEIGYLAPPVATNLFVASAIFKKPFAQVARAVMPTLAITCLALLLIIYIPTISLGALNLRDGRPLYAAFPWAGKPATPAVETVPEGPSLRSLTGKLIDELENDQPPPSDKPSP